MYRKRLWRFGGTLLIFAELLNCAWYRRAMAHPRALRDENSKRSGAAATILH